MNCKHKMKNIYKQVHRTHFQASRHYFLPIKMRENVTSMTYNHSGSNALNHIQIEH